MSDAKSNKMTKWIGFIILTLAAGLIYRVPYLKTVFYDNMVSDFGLTKDTKNNTLEIARKK